MMPKPTSIAATVLGNKGEYDKAIEDFNKAIELNPDSCRSPLQSRQRVVTQGRIR